MTDTKTGTELEQAIHARWLTHAPLVALLPAADLWQGGYHGQSETFATLTEIGDDKIVSRTSSSRIELTTVEVEIVSPSYSRAKSIKNAMRVPFNDKAWTDGDVEIVLCHMADSVEIEDQENSLWLITATLNITVKYPR